MIGASIEPTHMITGLRLVDKMFAPRGVSADVLSKNSPPQPRPSMAIVTGQGEIARSPGLGGKDFILSYRAEALSEHPDLHIQIASRIPKLATVRAVAQVPSLRIEVWYTNEDQSQVCIQLVQLANFSRSLHV